MTSLKRLFILACYVLFFVTEIGSAQNVHLTQEELESKNLVEVEPNSILPSDLANIYRLVPYKIRRARWGHAFTITYSQYNPSGFETDFVSPTLGSYDDLYGSPSMPLLELSYSYKWNFILGSIGPEIAYGAYKNEAADEALLGNATLNLQIIRAGIKFVADNLMYEPIFAPYGLLGAYTVLYKEAQANIKHDGNTEVAMYYGGGLLMQLGALDKTAAVDSYIESGIENSYVFVETRKYMASSKSEDPDFSTDFDLNVGLTLEF
ncbi:MAG: hypothetical protein A2Z20_01015 [Bdellovibrionales bacterium RBG_16_40_8]|nr:MAG: hypothetical protein A2Z20_01015 [Bdellovibrionales bacterium RBG_16_40_8]